MIIAFINKKKKNHQKNIYTSINFTIKFIRRLDDNYINTEIKSTVIFKPTSSSTVK